MRQPYNVESLVINVSKHATILYAVFLTARGAVFLINLVLAIVFLLSEVLLQTAFLDIPYTYVLRSICPDVYGNVESVKLHPYIPSGLLFVAVTALLLFFASGMYSEKISYANRYVPHANKALRAFNMYLNATIAWRVWKEVSHHDVLERSKYIRAHIPDPPR
ncbi:hypothetical protein ID866_3375 [Astraeus odoratus]|nr:hypothetical protein ID866_3375 [Astraeus odoratus]